ncbi:ligase-associated DNA damage response endonuclease PdeM [Bordetella genomosp. 4]|uniref:Phosphoesterase n=1 Tax=Bordetella genomosp. 4 TaxID=463044 RepID=A0A261U1K4_9BORD|nr:ligase-associated DNA damage response endonuclease PdeM [Bordetella genomosp. 4]OZI49353.1 phosphoesterase [Bordetella genomosp. 4]OZI54743.1 phosphoesterase [Bordetella genomosp. 4]
MPALPEGAWVEQLAGERMLLLGERAMFWCARRRLIIADLHLGKGHVFRRAGIAVPSGATEGDLRRLAALVAATDAQELWIVGDVLHGPATQAEWRDSWIRWRQAHASLQVAALTGNHDRALNGEALGICQLGESQVDGPFVFRHLPQHDEDGRHVIAGHVHPQARVPGVPRNWPVFWLRRDMTILPAFSAFTGGQRPQVEYGDALIACVDGAAIPIP